MNRYKNIQTTFHYLVLLVLLYVLILVKLENFHMRWWDESIFAVNTYEMMKNGEWFTLYFDGHPDLFNTKPPLTSWLQVLFVKVLGYNELSIRLPSALAACGTVLLLFRFLQKRWGFEWAWLSAIILMTSNGFVHFHTARTGTSDALLTFFMLAGSLQLFKFILGEGKRNILYLHGFMLLAFMTKLHAGFMFAPAFLILLIYSKQLKSFLTSLHFYLGIFTLIIGAFLIMYLREVQTPGYLETVFVYDWGRFGTPAKGNYEVWSFYIMHLISWRYSLWLIASMLGVLLLYKADNKLRLVLIGASLISFSYLLLITVARTKMEWYDMPVFPFLAMLGGYAIHFLLSKLDVNEEAYRYIMIVVIGIAPFFSMYKKTQKNDIEGPKKMVEASALFIHQKIGFGQQELFDGVTAIYNEWEGSLLFYKYKLKEQGVDLHITDDFKSLKSGNTVLVSNDSLKQLIVNEFVVHRLDSVINASLWKLE